MIKITFTVLLLVALFVLAFYLRKRRLLSNLILIFVACAGIVLTIEFVYRKFIRKPSVHTISFLPQVRDSVLGLRIEKAGEFSAINIYENGDTVFNVRYTILDDTLSNGPASPFRAGYRNAQSEKNLYSLVAVSHLVLA